MRRWCKAPALRIWGVGMAVLLVVTATACMSHSDAHEHDLPHPLLRLDAQVAIAKGRAHLRQFAASSLLWSDRDCCHRAIPLPYGKGFTGNTAEHQSALPASEGPRQRQVHGCTRGGGEPIGRRQSF